MPDATITSTASTFGTITGTFLADQSTITGTITGIVAGTLSGSVGVPGPVGPAGPQGPQGEPGPPGPGSTWGTITGVLSAQLDLQGQLDLKAPIASPVFTGDARAVTPAFGDDDTSISTTAFVQAALAGGTAVAKNLEVYVRNQSGSTIPAGSIVYISGATGNRPLITLAQANNDANSAQTIGFVKASIANNGFGYVMVRGELENIDTSALTEGAQLYLSPTTAGAWTTTKPSAPQHLVYVGIVIRSHPTQGVILVAVQNGYELNELHDVAIASVANNDLLAYESATSLWKNKTYSALGLLTTSDASATYLPKAGGVITGDIQSNNGSGYRSYDGAYKQTNVSASMIQLLDADVGGTTLSIESNGITFPSGKQTVHYPGTSILSGYATESWVTAGFYPLTGNPSGFLTSASLSGYATESWVTSQGYLTSSALTGYATQAWVDAQGYLQAGALTGYALESWVTSQGYLTDAPSDGNQYARKNGAWDVVSAGTSYITSVTAPLTVTGSDLSIDLTGYATESWVTGQNYLTDPAAAAIYETIANAAATYYPLSGNPSGFLVSSDLAPYLTSATAASTYQTISGMSSYAPKASPALTGNVTITTNSTSPALVIVQDGTGDVIQFKDVTSDTTYSFINQNGKVGTIASTTTNAGFNIPHGTAPTTPVNGDIWTTTSGLFMRQNGSTKQYVDLDGTQTINGTKTFSASSITLGNSTSAGTISLGTGATASGSTKTVNIGTSGAAGSTTNIAIGSTTGTSTTTLQGITNGVTQSAGDSSLKLATTAFVTTADNLKANLASPTFIGTPAAPTAAVDTNTTQLATTAYVVGQGYLKSATASSTYAPLASPALTGTPTAPTAIAGTNTTQIATTAFVQSAVSAGSGAVWGSITGTLSSQTDLQTALDAKLSTATAASTYAPLASPSLTGTPLSTTAVADTNTTQIATTAYVVGQASSTTPANNGTAAVGTSLKYARADHVHATDTTRAPLASPTFTGTVTIPAGASISGFAPLASPALTGTPTAPTATAGTNTTQIATTAFVAAAIPTNNVKAWVNFNGTGTVAIRASSNVSSITDNGTGDYTVNFTTAMTDANYAVAGFCGQATFSVLTFISSYGTYTQTTTAFRLKSGYSGGLVDTENIHVAFHR